MLILHVVLLILHAVLLILHVVLLILHVVLLILYMVLLIMHTVDECQHIAYHWVVVVFVAQQVLSSLQADSCWLVPWWIARTALHPAAELACTPVLLKRHVMVFVQYVD